jgi:hypothetical protein
VIFVAYSRRSSIEYVVQSTTWAVFQAASVAVYIESVWQPCYSQSVPPCSDFWRIRYCRVIAYPWIKMAAHFALSPAVCETFSTRQNCRHRSPLATCILYTQLEEQLSKLPQTYSILSSATSTIYHFILARTLLATRPTQQGQANSCIEQEAGQRRSEAYPASNQQQQPGSTLASCRGSSSRVGSYCAPLDSTMDAYLHAAIKLRVCALCAVPAHIFLRAINHHTNTHRLCRRGCVCCCCFASQAIESVHCALIPFKERAYSSILCLCCIASQLPPSTLKATIDTQCQVFVRPFYHRNANQDEQSRQSQSGTFTSNRARGRSTATCACVDNGTCLSAACANTQNVDVVNNASISRSASWRKSHLSIQALHQ